MISDAEAKRLPAGARHYRAYVGPPDRYDFVGASQFALLFALGMRDHHRVLDFGCGSLRLGRLLIPYLNRRRYFGIEPNAWLIDDALDRECGRDIVALKEPTFSERDDFECEHLGTTFDFVIAQSILSHTGEDLFRGLLDQVGNVLEPSGLFVFNYVRTDVISDSHATGWVYPGLVRFVEADVRRFLAGAGLSGIPIPWYHPEQAWFLAARHAGQLPSPGQAALLRGTVLRDPQFAASVEVQKNGL